MHSDDELEVSEVAWRECKRLRMTDREVEVAALMAKGYTNVRIAQQLCISRRSVALYTNHVYKKLSIYGEGRTDASGRMKRVVAIDVLRAMGL